MNTGSLHIDNNEKIIIKLSKIIKFIPHNNLNWYILELSASGSLKSSLLNISMLDLMKKVNSQSRGMQISFLEFIDLANRIDNLDECFIVGCKHENIQTINQIIENKSNYNYIIDYFDSSTLNVFSSDLVFLEYLLRSYNEGGFLI